MTFAQVIRDLSICGVFLVIGYVLREVTPLRKLYLPAAVIGGVLVLILGQQVLGVIEVPTSFSQYATPLTNVVFTALMWGITFNFDRLKSVADYTLLQMGSAFFCQVGICGLLGMFFLTIWIGMPTGWYLQVPFSFASGHGTAASMAAVFEGYGVQGTGDIGMVLSTVGLVSAMLIGTVFVNIGIRKGQAQFIKSGEVGKRDKAGLLPEDEQVSIGTTKVNNAAINNLLFQFAVVLAVWFFGKTLMDFGGDHVGLLAKLPETIDGIVGALILWPVMRALKVDKYVDKKTVSSIAGAAIDILIVGAVGTLNLSFIGQYLVPLLLISAVAISLTAAYVFFFAHKCIKDEWFEKAIFTYGMNTGVVATGFALHRMIDPNTESSVPECQGITSGITTLTGFPLYTLLIALAVNSPGMDILVGGGVGLACTVALWVCFRKKVKQSCGR